MTLIKNISDFSKEVSELIDTPTFPNLRPGEYYESTLSYPVVFMYSHLEERFESQLVKIFKAEDLDFLPAAELRCRFNSHRDIKIYSIRINPNEYEKFKELIETNPKETFKLFSNRESFFNINS